MYTHCPKCGHAPLPSDQAFPAACPGCGVILAKVGAAPPPRATASSRTRNRGALDDLVGDESERMSLADRLLEVPERVDPFRFWPSVALWIAFAAWGWVLVAQDVRTGDIGASFLHRPLLIFHEAGHVIFGIFGEWMMYFGGTLGQLVMPLVMAAGLLWKNHDPFGASLGTWLLGVSVLDVAPYVYDALDPQLTLLNGSTGEAGGHDWIWLLGYSGVIPKAQVYGAALHKIGALVIVLSLLWGAWILVRQHARLARHPA